MSDKKLSFIQAAWTFIPGKYAYVDREGNVQTSVMVGGSFKEKWAGTNEEWEDTFGHTFLAVTNRHLLINMPRSEEIRKKEEEIQRKICELSDDCANNNTSMNWSALQQFEEERFALQPTKEEIAEFLEGIYCVAPQYVYDLRDRILSYHGPDTGLRRTPFKVDDSLMNEVLFYDRNNELFGKIHLIDVPVFA